MNVTLITPHVGRKSTDKYVGTWQMEPLPIATLAGMTPAGVEITYFDERMESINFDAPTDLVGIPVETYTAKRSYEIAAAYRRRGIPVVLGGYHVALIPEEASCYADSIVVGPAEPIWEQLLRDTKQGCLRSRYDVAPTTPYDFVLPRRDIFSDKKYFKLSCVETGRGCPHACDFCSIMVATKRNYRSRSIESIRTDIDRLTNKTVFFVEDNFVGNPLHAKELCRSLIGAGIRWVGQGTLTMARDPELLELMRASGCQGVLIGFESFEESTLNLMGKGWNAKLGKYEELVNTLHRHGIALYGTFVFGYDTDTPKSIRTTVRRARDLGLFIVAFNHLVPFPGTPLYARLLKEGRLTDPTWWLDPEFHFGDISFYPKNMSQDELHELCMEGRREFYGWYSTFRRSTNLAGNFNTPWKALTYLMMNWQLRKEIDEKDGLPLGNEPIRPNPIEELPLGEV